MLAGFCGIIFGVFAVVTIGACIEVTGALGYSIVRESDEVSEPSVTIISEENEDDTITKNLEILTPFLEIVISGAAVLEKFFKQVDYSIENFLIENFDKIKRLLPYGNNLFFVLRNI